jgi:hypothetical protein
MAARSGSTELSLRIPTVILGPVMIAGGFLLLRWKPLGRTLLIAWAVGQLVLTAATTAIYFASYASIVRATTQPANATPLWFITWTFFAGMLQNGIVPLAIILVLMQREVSNLWAKRGEGGFEVVPVAKEVSPT